MSINAIGVGVGTGVGNGIGDADFTDVAIPKYRKV